MNYVSTCSPYLQGFGALQLCFFQYTEPSEQQSSEASFLYMSDCSVLFSSSKISNTQQQHSEEKQYSGELRCLLWVCRKAWANFLARGPHWS